MDHSDRRLVLQPLVHITEGGPAALSPPGQVGYDFAEQGTSDNHKLREALQEAGIIGRPFRELFQQNVDPIVVRAWYLWTWAPEQEWMDDPAGYVVNRLREGDESLDEFPELVQLTLDEIATLKQAWTHSEQFMGWPSLDGKDKLQRLAPLWASIFDAMRGYRT